MIDAELEAIRLLRAGGITEHLGTRRPNPLPNLWGRVFRVGGGSLSIVHERPQLGLEAYALDADGNPDRAAAADLLNRMRLVLLRVDFATFTPPAELFRPNEYGGVVNLPDPDSDHARFTTAIEFRARY